jgi:hypothetical protein
MVKIWVPQELDGYYCGKPNNKPTIWGWFTNGLPINMVIFGDGL